jgi:hypothetical protein
VISVAKISEVHVASIFMVYSTGCMSFCAYLDLCSKRTTVGKVRGQCPIQVNWGSGEGKFCFTAYIYTRRLRHPTHLDPEDGSSVYFQNISNTAYIHMV